MTWQLQSTSPLIKGIADATGADIAAKWNDSGVNDFWSWYMLRLAERGYTTTIVSNGDIQKLYEMEAPRTTSDGQPYTHRWAITVEPNDYSTPQAVVARFYNPLAFNDNQEIIFNAFQQGGTQDAFDLSLQIKGYYDWWVSDQDSESCMLIHRLENGTATIKAFCPGAGSFLREDDTEDTRSNPSFGHCLVPYMDTSKDGLNDLGANVNVEVFSPTAITGSPSDPFIINGHLLIFIHNRVVINSYYNDVSTRVNLQNDTAVLTHSKLGTYEVGGNYYIRWGDELGMGIAMFDTGAVNPNY